MKKSHDGRLAVILVVVLMLIDQVIKILVKTNMRLHESIEVTSWFYIDFVENSGMAFGMTFINKYILSTFRIVAIVAICWYIMQLVKRSASRGYVVCLSMIMAGAAGNIIDCMFYGMIFSASHPFDAAYFVPFGDGYAPFLLGKVVDMFYFPIIETTWPAWVPVWGGQPFVFFSPVFNFADACVSVGVILLLIFYRNELSLFFDNKKESLDTNHE
jgi:signal peptidase II